MGITKELLWRAVFLTNIKDEFDWRHHHVKTRCRAMGESES
ncbi:MAG: hypothetical protein ACI92B_000736 [Marinobacter maritimus]|jgi:hypothetical protein|tara:strand:+ start:505 stop:627 length:123 start_codon:yes stop_codon:yes gene_type:complete